jgi:hypothetical protein
MAEIHAWIVTGLPHSVQGLVLSLSLMLLGGKAFPLYAAWLAFVYVSFATRPQTPENIAITSMP